MKYTDTKHRGKFIVIYGSNNIGKSTQVARLISRLTNEHHEQVLLIKYPVYSLEPTGPLIKKHIKGGKDRMEMDDLELQKLYAQNRRDFQHIVETCLRAGINVIAEDYIGTGLAWGMTKGLSLKELLAINSYLLIPDCAILLDGERFKKSIEKHHIFENAGDKLWNLNRAIHLKLGKKFGWKLVRVEGSIESIHEELWHIVSKTIGLKG